MSQLDEGGLSENKAPIRPRMVAIAGCSGSGKTTLAAELARTLGGVHFHFDNYYLDLSHLTMEERARQNFDDPALIEASLLAEHVKALSQGLPIERPLYDFATFTRIPNQFERIDPAPFIFVEGLFALFYPQLLPLYDLRVYVDTPDGLCFERRLKRDMTERGRTAESVHHQYIETVRPAGLAYVRPSAIHADVTVDGTGALDWKVERVLSELRARNLLHKAS